MSSTLYKILYGLYQTKVPTMIWSNPGCGKTSTIKQLGRDLGVSTMLISGNKSDPTDFSGIPYLSEQRDSGGIVTGTIMKYSEPKYVRVANKNPNSILFFDELTTCPAAIQTPLLSIIQDGEFGEFTIPDTTWRVAAGNYNNITGTHNMSLALMNRFVHIFYKADAEMFINGIVNDFSVQEKPIVNSPEDVVNKTLKYRLAVRNFIKDNPQYLDQFPEEGEINEPNEVAYATPRSFELVTKIMAYLDENDRDYLEALIYGTIGEAVGQLFLTYLEDYTELNINLPQYLGKENEFVLRNPNRHDEVFQVVASMVYYLNVNPQRYFNLWVRVFNVVANKDKKYGDYPGYDNFIIKHIMQNINMLFQKGVLNGSKLASLKSKLDCYDLINLSSMN